jgi:hypothetical protein
MFSHFLKDQPINFLFQKIDNSIRNKNLYKQKHLLVKTVKLHTIQLSFKKTAKELS